MKKQRKTIDPSVKLEVVRMVKDQGLSVQHVSQSVDIGQTAIRRWWSDQADSRCSCTCRERKNYGVIPRKKNGPALGGYGAATMTNALRKAVAAMPTQLWRSLTSDRGKELSDHVRFTIEYGVKVFFADPRSSWQREANENTNGHLRQYLPKGTDLSRWSAQDIQAVD